MKFNNKYIFLFIFILSIIVISTTFFIGKSDNQKKENEFKEYTNAIQLLKTEHAEDAKEILSQLSKKYPQNFFIMEHLGIAYALTGSPDIGSSYYQKALELSPPLQLETGFMLQYGEILYYNSEYEKAKFILEKSLQLEGVEPYRESVNDLLTEISRKIKVTK